MFNFFKKVSGKLKTLGQLGEEFAQLAYENLGYRIVAVNEFNKKGKRLGEIDFIAVNKNKIIFVEVKTRAEGNNKFGSGAEAVSYSKQRKLLLAVKMFLNSNTGYQVLIPQIDVCLVEARKLDNSFKPVIIISNAVEDFN